MTKKLTRILGLFIFIFALLFETSCKNKEKPVDDDITNKETPVDDDITNYSEIPPINYKDVLSKPEKKYFVFIMSNTCVACEGLEDTICKYATLVKKAPNAYYPLYCLNSDDTENNGDIIAVDGDDSYEGFEKTDNYEDIKISYTPGLLVVEDGRIDQFISTKNTERPKTEIKEFFGKYIK